MEERWNMSGYILLKWRMNFIHAPKEFYTATELEYMIAWTTSWKNRTSRLPVELLVPLVAPLEQTLLEFEAHMNHPSDLPIGHWLWLLFSSSSHSLAVFPLCHDWFNPELEPVLASLQWSLFLCQTFDETDHTGEEFAESIYTEVNQLFQRGWLEKQYKCRKCGL